MNTFFLEKTSPSPTLPFCMKTWRQVHESYYSQISSISLGEIFVNFWKFQPSLCKSTKFVFRILWTCPDRQTCLGWNCNPQLLQPRFSTILRWSPLPFSYTDDTQKFSTIYTKSEYASNLLGIHFLEIIMQIFWWESFRGWDFSRPQLVVVSGLFGGNPLMDGIFVGHNLLLSQAFSVGIPWWMGFSGPQLIVVSGLFFLDGILAVTKPFSRTVSFFTIEFWLSRSLSHELFLFSWWNSGYHEACLTNFFFLHDGILAITKPFSRTFLFSRWNSGYHEAFLTNCCFFTMEFWLPRSLSHELFLFSRWNSGYHEAFLMNFFFFHNGILEIRNLGEDSFHIYISQKSIYIGSASLKTLPLDLEPPLQGKEYGPSYSNTTIRSKTNFCSEITYRHMIRIF
jgi:hypothetical protein